MGYRYLNNQQGEYYENKFGQILTSFFPKVKLIPNNTHGIDLTLKFGLIDIYFEVKSVWYYVGKTFKKNSIKFKDTDYCIPDYIVIYLIDNKENNKEILKVYSINQFQELCDKLNRKNKIYITKRKQKIFHIGVKKFENLTPILDLKAHILNLKNNKENNSWVKKINW